ncbi:MAG: family 10 glycosylhydrolase, partial [Bacteroidetes bacterium]|nr:family 10 glycosylhydrolase [Bacteroidota bacterium]
MKTGLCMVLLLLSFSSQLMARDLPDPESRGVWVTGDYLTGGTSAIENLVGSVSNAHLNEIYIDVWYQGSTIYPSSVDSSAGGPLQNPAFAGTDPLRTLIDIAHKHGIEVFAWFEFGFAVGQSNDSANIPPIFKAHPDWAMLQQDTSKDFENDPYGYFFWLDPAVPSVEDFMVDLYKECAARYPDIDGIEMDRMRYPGYQYGYSAEARQRYKAQFGVDPLTLSDTNLNWANWRREQVTNVVRGIYQAVKSVNSNCVLSNAAYMPWTNDGLLIDMLEQWEVWADSGYVDEIEPELYFTLPDFNSTLPSLNNLVPTNFYLNPGISITAIGGIENTISAIKSARQRGLQGETLWYYGYLQGNGYLGSLRNSVYQSVTLPSHDDILVDNAT